MIFASTDYCPQYILTGGGDRKLVFLSHFQRVGSDTSLWISLQLLFPFKR